LNHLLQNPAFSTGILLGDKTGFDKIQKEEISIAGIQHLMAISGMHVGLIYLILNYLLSPFILLKWPRLKTMLLLIAIWGFCFICGLPPSAVRATTMISFLLIGQLNRNDTSALNILCFAAFLMLIIEPYDLFSISFQFSFLAVWSIICIHPLILKSLQSKYKIIDTILISIRISIAIQVALIPLQLYYFYKVTLLAVISNIVFTPLASILLYLSSLLAISPLAILNQLLAGLINLIADIFQLLLQQTKHFNFMISPAYYPSLIAVVLFLMILLLLFQFRRFKWYYISPVYLLFFLSMQIKPALKQQLCIFKFDQSIVIEAAHSNQTIQYLSRDINEYVSKQVYESVTKRGIQVDSIVELKSYKQDDYFLYGRDTVQIYDKKIWWYQSPRKHSIIYVRNNSYLKKELLVKAKPPWIIVDGTCSEKYQQFVKIFGKENNIQVWNMSKKGAFVLH
jgi:competence protein ComEC